MTALDILKKLENFGSENTKRIYMNHGVKEPLYGVKIGDMKKVLKEVKRNHVLGLALYETGNYDARYLAHYMVDPKQMTKEDLDHWLDEANCYMISEYAVSQVAAESSVAIECIQDWINRDNKYAKSAAYSTYSNYISIMPNEDLDLKEIHDLMIDIKKNIHKERNRIKYTMNNFIICVGSYIPELTEEALDIAEAIGTVSVHMGNTSCKVPNAIESINTVMEKERLGKKRKKARC